MPGDRAHALSRQAHVLVMCSDLVAKNRWRTSWRVVGPGVLCGPHYSCERFGDCQAPSRLRWKGEPAWSRNRFCGDLRAVAHSSSRHASLPRADPPPHALRSAHPSSPSPLVPSSQSLTRSLCWTNNLWIVSPFVSFLDARPMRTLARPVTLRTMPAGVSTLSSDGWARSKHLLCIPTFVLTAPRLRPCERAKDRFWAAVTAERLAEMAQRLS